MLIRKWTFSDVDEIFRIEQESFSDPWSKTAIASTSSFPNFLGFVLEKDGFLLGYVGASFVLDEGEILLVAVDKMARGKGYGKQLMTAICEELSQKGVKVIFLEVRKSNFVAISCYEGCGFTKISERKGYYSDGEDAIIMEKKL